MPDTEHSKTDKPLRHILNVGNNYSIWIDENGVFFVYFGDELIGTAGSEKEALDLIEEHKKMRKKGRKKRW
ncbi:MAG: hypothetical protein PHE67_00290 [Campylobacterales bacterium]|nr:hypothetical protein [Campylobacterales bacterium]